MELTISGRKIHLLSESDIARLDAIDGVSEVISGCARRVDRDGEAWAENKEIPVRRFSPEWNRFGRGAGVVTNREMAMCGDAVALLPGSRGTKSMFEEARKAGIVIYDFRVSQPKSRLK